MEKSVLASTANRVGDNWVYTIHGPWIGLDSGLAEVQPRNWRRNMQVLVLKMK